MKTSSKVRLIGAALLILNASSVMEFGQTTNAQTNDSNTSFEPLNQFRSAVLAGQAAFIRALYSSDTKAFAQIPGRRVRDLALEESEFWSKQSALGLIDMVPQILEETSPLGAVKLVLRIEMIFPRSQSVVSATQIWVKEEQGWRIRITYRSDPEPMAVSDLPQPKMFSHLYPDPSDAQHDLDAALETAKGDGKHILIIFGANWCYDCHVLDAGLHSNRVGQMLSTKYHLVHINIGDGDQNEELAKRFQIDISKGIPSVAMLDRGGRLVTSKTEQKFQPAEHITMGDLIALLNGL